MLRASSPSAAPSSLSPQRVPFQPPALEPRRPVSALSDCRPASTLAVVTEVEPDEAMDPAFLDAILPLATRFRIGDGETKRQDLKISGR